MRIKRFEAIDNKSALAMVKKELGDDAIILATRTLPVDKKNGKNAKPLVEIVAAMDYDLDELITEDQDTQENKPGNGQQTYGYKTVRKKEKGAPVFPEPKNNTNDRPTFRAAEDIHTEAHDLRLRFANLLKSPATEKGPSPANDKAPQKSKPKKQDHPVNPADIKKWRDNLINKIKLTEPTCSPSDKPTIVALVGSTGVGKTTTAAKMAAWHSLRKGKRVALLSMDCYRIGATDQLRTYAKIMRLPCEIVLRKKDLSKALARHMNKDVIIIDTAGKSPYDEEHINELKDWFSPCEDIEPHLVLSATTKKEDLQTVIQSFAGLAVSSLILTKLDETRAYAALCQQVVASSLPVSYLSTGQRVPEDFLMASKKFLDSLFKEGWSSATACLNNDTQGIQAFT